MYKPEIKPEYFSIILDVDGEQCTLQNFIEVNTADDVFGIEQKEWDNVLSLKVNEQCTLYGFVGTTTIITRVE